VLAAGSASRFGEPKQLLEWEGEPLVRKAARAALEAGFKPVRVVTGYYADQVSQALEGLPVEIVYNPDWQAGQSTSLKAGLSDLPAHTGSAVFLLADMPYVESALLRALWDLHAETMAPIVAPRAEGRRGNPVLFDRSTFPDLSAVTGDMGGRSLFGQDSPYEAAWLDVEDPDQLLDLDTRADLEKLYLRGGK
jgi:molybdenum cofactor cytidylyltransferase